MFHIVPTKSDSDVFYFITVNHKKQVDIKLSLPRHPNFWNSAGARLATVDNCDMVSQGFK